MLLLSVLLSLLCNPEYYLCLCQFWTSIFRFPLRLSYVLITTPSFICPNHVSQASLIVSLMFVTLTLALISSVLVLSMSILFIPIIHLNIYSPLFFLVNLLQPSLCYATSCSDQTCYIRCKNLALNITDCVYLCLSDETLKAVGPFYLVSMPGEVKKDPTQGY